MSSLIAKLNHRYAVFSLLYVAWCISYIDRAAIAFAAIKIGAEFHLGAADLGLLLSSFYLGYALMQVPGGWLADRFGAKVVVVASIFAWSVFTGLTGLAWSLTSMLMIRLLFGLGEGAFPSASVKGVSEVFAHSERPKASAFLMSSNYFGSMVAPLVIAPLILHFGWRNVFHCIGIVGLAFSLFYWLMIRPTRASVEDQGIPSRQIDKASLRALMKMPLMWQIVTVWFGLSLVNKGLDSWMPTYLMTQRGLDLKSVGLLSPLPFVLACFSTAIGGWVMLRFFDGREKYLLVGSATLTAIFLYFMYTAATVTGVIVFQCTVYFFKSFVLATAIALPTKILSRHLIGTAIGMVNLGGQSAGFVAPLVIGVLVSAFNNYDYAFAFLIAAACLSVVVSLFIHTTSFVPRPTRAAASI